METWVEIKSDLCPFDQRPWMKSSDITDKLVEAIDSKKYTFLRTNYPNGDMVGHTGDYEATIIGVESVDLNLRRVMEACKRNDCILLVTADHGNADEMYQKQKKETDPLQPKTSHTLNKVPFIIYNNDVEVKQEGNFGLSNVAATVVELLGYQPDEVWNESIIK